MFDSLKLFNSRVNCAEMSKRIEEWLPSSYINARKNVEVAVFDY